MNSPLIIALLGLVATVGAGTGVWSLLTAGATKRKLLAEADSITASTAAALSQSAREMLVPLRERVRELEHEASEARREAAAARQEISDLRTSVADLTSVLRSWRTAVLDPSARLDQLRVMVTQNGRA